MTNETVARIWNYCSGNRSFNFHQDPSHGWLAVKKWMVEGLEIADKISGCSYEKGQTVYLEEDLDAKVFLDALKKVMGEHYEMNVVVKHTESYSPVRFYNRYTKVS